MRTRSVVLATTLTVGLVAGVGSSALAIAFVPGDSSGVTQGVQAIASPTQDPAEGSISWFIEGAPVTVTVAGPIVIDGGDEPDTAADPVGKVDPAAEPDPSPSASNSGAPSGNTGNGNSGPSADDKAQEDKAKKAAEEQAKKDKKAAEDLAKKDKKDTAKKDKQNKSDDAESDE